MAEEENEKQTEEGPEAEAEEAPEAEAAAAEEQAAEEPAAQAPAEEQPEEGAADEDAGEPAGEGDAGGEAAPPAADDDTDWKTRRRLERSRRPVEARPQRSAEERQRARQEQRRAAAVSRRRHRQSRRAKKGEPRTGTPRAERRANPAKVRQGVVVSDSADKTITVRIDIARRHPAYEKIVRRSRTLRAHDESNEAGEGDVVRVVETRPISRSKRWRLLEILEKAK